MVTAKTKDNERSAVPAVARLVTTLLWKKTTLNTVSKRNLTLSKWDKKKITKKEKEQVTYEKLEW